MVTDCV